MSAAVAAASGADEVASSHSLGASASWLSRWSRRQSELGARATQGTQSQRSLAKEAELDGDEVLTIRDPELLRAVTARRVLARFGRLFKASTGTADTFELSKPVEWIDGFLSHAWSTPGWLKYLVLLYRTNGRLAPIVAIIVHLVVHGGEWLGLWSFSHMYTLRGYLVDGPRTHEMYVRLHFVFALAAFWITMLFGQYLPFAGQRACFLDKVCIHQTDEVKKQAGIHMLGALLRRSKCMMVFWQPLYFERAWCVFELAAFLHMNRPMGSSSATANIDFLPLRLPLFSLGLNLFHTLSTIGAASFLPLTICLKPHMDWIATFTEPVQVLYIFVAMSALLFALYATPALFLWPYVRQHLLDRRTLLGQLESFTLKDAKCYSADDYAFIRSKVVQWFGSTGAFDTYVREVLTQKVGSILVRQGPIPYRFVLFGSLPHLFTAASALIEAFRVGDSQMGWQTLVMCVNLFAVSDPIAMALVLRLGAWSLDSPAAERAWVRRLAGPIATALIFALPTGLAVTTAVLSMPLWVAVLILLVEAAAVACLYRGKPGALDGAAAPQAASPEECAPHAAAPAPAGPDAQDFAAGDWCAAPELVGGSGLVRSMV